MKGLRGIRQYFDDDSEEEFFDDEDEEMNEAPSREPTRSPRLK
jgi:hypothetical protein